MKTETVIRVEGMTCGGCARRVEASLRALDGVEDVAVTLREGEVRVTHDPVMMNEAALRARLLSAGYPPRDEAV